jgi:hypothetical protein
LVSQHLKYQLTKIFPHNINTELKNDDENKITISTNDIIDPKYQFSDGKIIVNEDASSVEVLQNIFEDFINGKNLAYCSIFLEFMINNILALYSKFRGKTTSISDLIITEFDDWKTLTKDFAQVKKIIYFQTSLLVESDFTNLE